MFPDAFSKPPELPTDCPPLDRSIDVKPARRKHRDGELAPHNPSPAINNALSRVEMLPHCTMKITQAALLDMLDYLLAREPEAAGLLLGPTNHELLITHFVPDHTGRSSPASFQLGADELNDVLKRMKPAGINCKGIAHSHPAGIPSPSHGDLAYLRRLFGLPTNHDAAHFYMPIVSGGRLFPYVYVLGRVCRAELVLV